MPIVATMVFIALDVVSGILKAVKAKNISSSVARDGVFHKSAYVLLIFCAVAAEWGMTYMNLGFSLPMTIGVCTLISATEIFSIVENAAELNPDLKGTKLLELFNITNHEQ